MSHAHWRKCDFQIHSPRDPNWQGHCPPGRGDLASGESREVTDAEIDEARASWAEDFVDACVARKLSAIAVTDHHEMVMIPYIHAEILRRVAADANFDLWLFPGMELTAEGGKQCLLIFDANLSEDWCKQAQGALGISFASNDTRKSKGPARVTQLAMRYPDIGRALDTVEQLRGRYIVLPNISQGNSHTVLTDGAHAEFRRMPYVGGYLDCAQSIDTISSRNRKRLSGKTPQWSERKIYPLPTSDCRSSDFSGLGENSAWIKLAEPTAEAIRQAFLGHRSRIRIEPPEVPSLVVSKVEISGSTVLRATSQFLSPELNSIIGGRGSGKSSLLEYLSFGLGRSCYDLNKGHYSASSRMKELLNDTIVSKSGEIILTILQDGAQFEVRRGVGTAYQPQIKYPDGSLQTIPAKELRALFPAVVYSQGELAEIGKQAGQNSELSDLLQFVDPEYKREDERLSASIEDAKTSVQIAIQTLTKHWQKQAQSRRLKSERDSLAQRVAALEKTLPDLSDDKKAVVGFFETANEFEVKRVQAAKHADQLLTAIGAVENELLVERDVSSSLDGTPKKVAAAYSDLYRTFQKGLLELKASISGKRSDMQTTEEIWQDEFSKARGERDSVLEELGAHRTATSQIIKLREQIGETTSEISDVDALIQSGGNVASQLSDSLSALRLAVDERNDRTQSWAAEIERLSSGKIVATVDRNGDKEAIFDAMNVIAAKTGSQAATRNKALGETLAVSSFWEVRDRLHTDCLALLHWRYIGAATGETAPLVTDLIQIVGGTEKIRSALTENMDADKLGAISAAVPKPNIRLSYSDGSRQISFDKASEGQRAAALLFMLLEQSGGPLIIDQPEGDLDNKIIAELTDKLHEAKSKRQLIFASHNANIVVNGSSELVGHLDICDDGERDFSDAGAIDKSNICKLITSTMEGGKRAFKDRLDKYGY